MSASLGLRIVPLALAIMLGSCAKPVTGPALTAAAEADLRAGRNQVALAEIQQRLKENPRDARAAYLRGVAFARLGRYERAALSFAAFRRAGGNAARLDLDQGGALLNAGDAAAALPMLQAYRTSHPTSGEALLLTGRARLMVATKGKPRPDAAGIAAAEAMFRTALAMQDSHNAAQLLLAIAATARNDRPAARRALDTLLAEAPRSPQVQLLEAAAHSKPKG